MLQDNQQIRSLVIVVVGKFNPAIIQPYWLAKKDLIKEQEANNAKIEIVHPQLTRIDLDWVFIDVSTDKFEFRSLKEAFFPAVRDLMVGILYFLPETPITFIGLNHILHYTVQNDKQYYEIGNKLVPLQYWEEIIDAPRMLDLQIIEQKRKDKLNGHFIIQIQPSDQSIGKYGITVAINDHLALENNETDTDTKIVNRLLQIWDSSFNRVNEIINRLSKNLTQ